MATAKNNAKNTIDITNLVSGEKVGELDMSPAAGPNQLALAIKPAKPTKLRINTVQGKALARETAELIEKQVKARRESLHTEVAYLAALNGYLKTDPLLKALQEYQQAVLNLKVEGRLNRLIELHNEEVPNSRLVKSWGGDYYEKPYQLARVETPNVVTQLELIKDAFFQNYFKQELEDLKSVSLDEDIIYRRIMVKTITFTNAGTLEQFQRGVVAELAPRIARVVPTLNPDNYTAEGEAKLA